MTAAPARFDPFAALRALQAHQVRFVVIGGVAGRLWGSPTMTNDLDVCYARDPENLTRLAAALTELGATLRGAEPDLPFHLDAKTLGRGQNFTFTTTAGSLDALGVPEGVKGFGELDAHAVAFDLGDGLVVPVCDLDDLIRMKRAAARPKDRIEVEVLAALRQERG
ncbi:MAG TPA: hypothetical protein VFW71_15025 [Actinomycetota bacterium]|nr:hypothetical protein [Actinomycetota bacterium]